MCVHVGALHCGNGDPVARMPWSSTERVPNSAAFHAPVECGSRSSTPTQSFVFMCVHSFGVTGSAASGATGTGNVTAFNTQLPGDGTPAAVVGGHVFSTSPGALACGSSFVVALGT